MKTQWHRDRIDELRHQRDIRINQDNRTHTTLIAYISLITIFFIFEINKSNKNILWIIILGISFFICLWAINKEVNYVENTIIQKNYNILLNRN